jgi:hypothetical protein
MACVAGIDLHACVYELASSLKGAVDSQICQSATAMPGRLAPLMAANHRVAAMFIVFDVQNTNRTRSRGHHTGVAEPFLIPLYDSLLI